MNELDTRVLNAAERLELAVKKSTEAAERLLKCAEGISNPTYTVHMDGKTLEILAVQHFQGQISLQVKWPFNDIQRSPLGIEEQRRQIQGEGIDV